ncbi:hypothetical protein [uncultured Mediterranean phage uvMED]|nr:hypothetical protein [uncultured Mediterranean phage uvMED]BAR17561.1 hypothetical protein [uncultured Mediterranean phage uvMED]
MKYALIENNIVKQISYQPEDGYVEVSDDVFADMVKDGDTYDYTDEFKASHSPIRNKTESEQDSADEIANRESGKAKLKELGLTDAQIKALMGVE